MRVLFLTGVFPERENPYSGVFIYNQAAALKKNGIDVCVLYLDLRSIRRKRRWGLGKYRYKEIDVYRFAIPCGPVCQLYYFDIDRFAAYAFNRVRKAEGDFALIHAHFFDMGYAARRIHEKYQIPYIVTEHSSFLLENRQNHEMRKHIAPAYQSAEKVIAVGNVLKEKMKGYTDKEVVVIPNILSDRFSYSPDIHKDSSVFRFISVVGRLTKDKRVDLLVKAFLKLLESKKDVHLSICGDGTEMQRLKQYVEEMNAAEQIDFLGIIDNHELPDVLRGCDCFVLPSVKETFGVVYIEAAGCGLPVIAAESGGPYDIVDQENGIIVKNDDINELQHAMAYIYENRERYDPQLISDKIRNKFGEKAFIESIGSIYHRIERYRT